MTTTALVGNAATGQVEFLEPDGVTLYDPTKVVLTAVSPFGTASPPATVGVTAGAVRISLGLYALTWTPTLDGDWIVIGDGFDSGGIPTGSAVSVPITVNARRPGTPAQIQAQSIVEQYIQRPIALVTESVELYSGEDGILQLPRRPVVSIASVTGQLGTAAFTGGDPDESFDLGFEGSQLTDSEDIVPNLPVVPLPTGDAAGRIADPGVVAFTWYQVVYTHGWADENVPQIIRTVIAAVEARITANPAGVTSEHIGAGYGVTYSAPTPAWLTADEKAALAQFRPKRVGSLTMSTPIGGLP